MGRPAIATDEDPDGALYDLKRRRDRVADDVDAAHQAGEVQAYIALLPQLAVLEDRIDRAENRAVRLAREAPSHPAWTVRADQLEAELLGYYGLRGPQYRILIKQMVAAEMRFEQAQASGRDIDIAEFRQILGVAQSTVSMLQKYTESTKIDHTEGRNEGIEAVLRVVEEILAPAYPELYAHIVNTLVERAKGGHRAASPPRALTS